MKHIFFFLSILFAVQIGQAQEVWNACNSTVTIIPAPAYDSTFFLSAPSRAALAKGMANWTPSTSSGASYLVYTALLTQTGTSAPVATVLENTLGGTPVWSYFGTGQYTATLSGVFTSGKTIVEGTNYVVSGDAPLLRTLFMYGDNSHCYLHSFDSGVYADDIISGGMYVTIKVYP